MNLIDKDDDVATCLDLFKNLLEALFEITAVTGTCN